MNSQDITRALIDTTVARAMVEMDADPKRSVRKLCDLGRQFSRGRFQNQIFAIFQDLLRNDESPYYQAIDFLLRSNDPEALRQFGINIGYNSFTYGAQILRQKQKELSFAVPWVVKLRLDSRIPDTYDSSFFASVVRTGLTYAIYSYQLCSMDHHVSSREIGLLYRDSSSLSPAARQFIQTAREVIPSFVKSEIPHFEVREDINFS